MSGEAATARLVMDMADAHQRHQPNRRNPALVTCKGSHDPLTGHWCQHRGTATEHREHRQERIEAALVAAYERAGGRRVYNVVYPDGRLRFTLGVDKPETAARWVTPGAVLVTAVRVPLVPSADRTTIWTPVEETS